MDDRETVVKDAFSKFLSSHSPEASIGSIDEIVLSYLVCILEELGADTSSEDLFDVEQFTEMMEAYIPGFASINSITVSEWMFELAGKLSNENKSTTVSKENKIEMQSLVNDKSDLPQGGKTVPNFHVESPNSKPECNNRSKMSEKKIRRNSSRTNSTCSDLSTGSNDVAEGAYNVLEDEEEDERVKLLLEMFPSSCSLEISHCIALANGDIEEAVQLVLFREEAGENLTKQSTFSSGVKKKVPDSTSLKKSIVDRYSYVDTAADKREHKPVMPKGGQKKLIRYLDGRVVSTKGERYKEMKSEEDDDMKKTYVNLKPARQYRFH